jgi:hypothetical protein
LFNVDEAVAYMTLIDDVYPASGFPLCGSHRTGR